MARSILYQNSLIEEISKTIDRLLFEDDEIKSNKIKYKVIEDLPDNEELPPNSIEISEAKKIDPSVSVGDEIEIDTYTEKDITEILNNPDSTFIGEDELKAIGVGLGGSPSGRRRLLKIGKGVVKIAPKALFAVIKGRSTLKKIKNSIKKKFKKQIPVNNCYCAKLLEDYCVEDDPSKPEECKPNRDAFESDINDQGELVKEELLKKWDECVDTYGEFDNKDRKNRKQTIYDCKDVEDWWSRADKLMDKIVQELAKFYDVNEIQKAVKGKKSGSVAEKVTTNHTKIKIAIEGDLDYDPCNSHDLNAGTHIFTISGQHKEGGNTVLLELGGNKYVWGFDNAMVNVRQSNSTYCFVGGVTSGKAVTWTGKIIEYI